MAPPGCRAAVDVGSAFTHVCLMEEEGGRTYTARVPSTPCHPGRAVLAGLAEAARRAGLGGAVPGQVVLGHTLAAAALLEGPRRAKVALLLTRGFKDVLFTGRQQRPQTYLLSAAPPPPLVPRRLTFEVTERLLAGGEVLVPLEEGEVEAIAAELRRSGVTSVAVCMLHAPANPSHELKAREILSRLCPGMHVSLSAEVLPEAYEYERAVATVVDALAAPALASILAELQDNRGSPLRAAKPGLFLLSSDGTALDARRAAGQSAHTVFSSFAGGATAGLHLARQTGRPNLIILGMGNSCTYIAVIQGEQLRCVRGVHCGGYPLAFPSLEVRALGLGGSSTVVADAGGVLRLGPPAAPAGPAPACRGTGGAEPTLTGAQLVLGRLCPCPVHPRGEQELHGEQARAALEQKIARPLGIAPEEAARKTVEVASASVAREIRAALARQGGDFRDFALVACGGAGPQYGVEIARLLGIAHVLIPPRATAFAALGMLHAGIRQTRAFPAGLVLDPSSLPRLAEIFAFLEEAERRELAGERPSAGEAHLFREVDLRLSGTSRLFTVPFPRGRLCPEDLAILRRSFLLQYEQESGFPPPEEAVVEVVNARVAVIAAPPCPRPGPPAQGEAGPGVKPVPAGEQAVYFTGQRHSVPVYVRDELGPGSVLPGPALIVEEGTTTVVWPGAAARVDRWGNLVIDVRAGGGEDR
ncbi:hydantoinase/oxoprolinase family protein [Desulfovirgula thermocuniculi]|uniref:hydantoinase/oxoprolinase family protein n=1 Tax=Desulfovirgula thermocuniculi TaxID=348842 RepID=UPI0003FE159C|nr:hydantoinase/oxoprolinase family protein [Desulfovirgula thermocuniculi]